jgi:hypothetical protein
MPSRWPADSLPPSAVSASLRERSGMGFFGTLWSIRKPRSHAPCLGDRRRRQWRHRFMRRHDQSDRVAGFRPHDGDRPQRVGQAKPGGKPRRHPGSAKRRSLRRPCRSAFPAPGQAGIRACRSPVGLAKRPRRRRRLIEIYNSDQYLNRERISINTRLGLVLVPSRRLLRFARKNEPD